MSIGRRKCLTHIVQHSHVLRGFNIRFIILAWHFDVYDFAADSQLIYILINLQCSR